MDINEAVKKVQEDPGAMLVDVRTPDEYEAEHIEGAVNVPLEAIQTIWKAGADEDTPLYLYCISGSRAGRAKEKLETLGYVHVVNAGGIEDYKGRA